MRVSILDEDDGAWPLLDLRHENPGKQVKVFLNDVAITHWITADTVQGFVLRSVTDAAGPVWDAAGENWLEETLHGNVRIVTE